MKAILKDKYLEFNNAKYHRTRAEDMKLGGYGEKKVTGVNEGYVDLFDIIEKALPIEALTTTSIEYSTDRELEAKVVADATAADVHGEANVTRTKLEEGNLELVKLRILPGDVKEAINDNERLLENLADHGSKARVVTSIWVVVEAEFSRKITSASSLVLNGKHEAVGTAEVSLTLNGDKENAVVLSSGTTLAYMAHRPEWDAASRKKITRCTGFEDDQAGIF